MTRALFASVLHLVIAPAILWVYGLTPNEHLNFFSSRETTLERLLSVSVLALWVVWVWGLWSVAVAARRRSTDLDGVDGLAAPHIVLALAALLAAVGGGHSPTETQSRDRAIAKSEIAETSKNLSRGETAALAAVAGVVLQRFFERQDRLVRSARRGTIYERHTRITQLTVHRLLAMRKGIESGKHLHIDATGFHSTSDDTNEGRWLPLGYRSVGCISVRLSQRTVIVLEPNLDNNGIAEFIESFTRFTASSEDQLVTVKKTHEGTVVQIDLCGVGDGRDVDVSEYRLRSVDGSEIAILEPGDVTLIPFRYSTNRRREFDSLSECLKLTPTANIIGESECDDSQVIDLVVRVMGPLEVVCSNGKNVSFRKSKSAELLAWLVLHRDRPSRDIARTAMWDSNVQDATFNNVVSELRRAVKEAIPSLDLGESRHQRNISVPNEIRTDVEIMESAWVRARREDSPELWLKVYESVQAIRGLPFESTNFEWADAEGLTSHIMLKVMNVCGDLADHFLQCGDVEKVFHVTELGLRALPGSEEMLEWRQKALALRSTVKT